MQPNSLTFDIVDVSSNSFVGSFSDSNIIYSSSVISAYDLLKTQNQEEANDQYESITSFEETQIPYLFDNYKLIKPRKIEGILRDFVKNRIDFDSTIATICQSPDGILLDLAKSVLIRFEKPEYDIVISYLKNNKIDPFLRSYLVEAIANWGTIDKQTRIKDLQDNLNENTPSILKQTIQSALSEISN